MDRKTVEKLRQSINEALEEVGAAFGMQIGIKGTISFNKDNASIKVEAAEITASGVQTKEATDFIHYAHRYGLTADLLGKTFQDEGEEYTIKGLKTRSRKYPVLTERSDGQGVKFRSEHIKHILGID